MDGLINKLVLFFSLHHSPPFLSHPSNEGFYIDGFSSPEPVDEFHGFVNGDEGTRSPNSGAAVHNQGSISGERLTSSFGQFVGGVDNIADSDCGSGGSEIGPFGVMDLVDFLELSWESVSSKNEGPQGEILVFFFVEFRDFNVSEFRRDSCVKGPVNVRLLFSAFQESGEHDDDRALLFPDHSPEIRKS